MAYGNTRETAQWVQGGVYITDSNGNRLKISQIEENRLGSECSGSDGDLNRILTLVNTSETGSPFSVWVDTQLIKQTDMTITNNTTSSTIQFTGISIYDSQVIRVLYYI